MSKKPDLEEFLDEEEPDSPAVEVLKRRIANLERKLRREAGLTGLVLDAVQTVLDDAPRVVVPPRPKISRKKHREVGYLHLSDLHLGAITPTFTPAIAEERLGQIVEKVEKIAKARRTAAKLDELVIGLNGDIIDGSHMRFGHPQHVECNAMEQSIYEGPRILCGIIGQLMGTFNKVRVVVTPGNHERMGRFGSFEASGKMSWATVLGETTKHLLRHSVDEDRLAFHVETEFYNVIQIGGTRVCQTHGDSIRGGSSASHMGLPIAGIASRVSRWRDSLPDDFDMVVMGHFHRPTFAHAGKTPFVIGGSIETGGDYGAKLGLDSVPSQTFMVFRGDGDRGAAGLLAYHLLYVD